jgi:perosamine synthetase
MIRLTVPSIEEDDLQAVREVLETGYLVQGPSTAEFEQHVAKLVGVKHAVAVSNCTAALHLALLSLDVGFNDLVITTAYSWPATGNVIELCGATPIFVDTDPATFNIDPDSLEATLNRLMANPTISSRVKAIIPVHTFGQMADMPAILALAGAFKIPVIEDAACALGADLEGRQAGSWGEIGCFSFHPRKAITTGEGGMIVTDRDDIAWKLRALRNHGQAPDGPPDFIMPGFNYRITEFQAALGIRQLNKLHRVIGARRQGASCYNSLLEGTSIQSPIVAGGQTPVYQSYVVLLPAEVARRRATIIQAMGEKGIQTTIGTYHMPMTTYFRTRYGFCPGDFPNTDQVFSRSLTLPLHEYLTTSEQEEVIATLLSSV